MSKSPFLDLHFTTVQIRRLDGMVEIPFLYKALTLGDKLLAAIVDS